MANDKKNKKDDANDKLLAVSPKTRMIGSMFYNDVCNRMVFPSTKRLWKRKLMPPLRAGLIDKLVDNSKNEGLKDEFLILFAEYAMHDSIQISGIIAHYALEVASMIKDDAKKNALYRVIAEFYNENKTKDRNYFEAMLAAYARIKPRSDKEAAEINKFKERGIYEYASSYIGAGNAKEARKFFEMCGAQDEIDLMNRVKDYKGLLKGCNKKNKTNEPEKATGIEAVLKKEERG